MLHLQAWKQEKKGRHGKGCLSCPQALPYQVNLYFFHFLFCLEALPYQVSPKYSFIQISDLFLAPIGDFHPIPSVPRIAFGATCILDFRFIFRDRILLFDSQQHLPCGRSMQNHICLELLWRTLNPFHLRWTIFLYLWYYMQIIFIALKTKNYTFQIRRRCPKRIESPKLYVTLLIHIFILHFGSC